MKHRSFLFGVLFFAGAALVVSCGSGSDDGLYTGTGANGGRVGASGSGATIGAGGSGPGGASGTKGSGGTTDASAGTAGVSGTGASSGHTGTGPGGASGSGGTSDASAGTAGGGNGGTLGASGGSGTGGTLGTAGAGGNAGSSGRGGTGGASGSAGANGSAGASGSAGAGGTAGSGSGGSGGSGGTVGDAGTDAGPKACTSNTDCETDELCAKASCDAASGSCQARPKNCASNYAPVCGCDKVNYWNDCLRRQLGVASDTAGECAASAPCGGLTSVDCPVARASCAYLLESDSECGGADTFGACWVVPEQCPPIAISASYRPCSSGPNQCEGKCQAIKAQRERFVDPSCAVN